MLEKNNIEKRFYELIDFFHQSNVTDELTISFISNNFELLFDEDIIINENLFFIFNNQHLYGIVIAKDDKYGWATPIDNIFPKIKYHEVTQSDINKIDKSDYIVEMILDFANSEKIKKALDLSKPLNIEQKIKVLKDIGLNSNGYHIR